MKKPSSDKAREDPIPTAEWVVAGVGLALLFACLAFLLYKAFNVEDNGPSISFRVERIVSQDGGSLVIAEVANSGGETVSSLQVRGSAAGEEQEVVIDFLPARSTRKFGMFFQTIPEKETVEFDAGGYQDP